MEKQSRKLFSPSILNDFLSRYKIDSSKTKLLDGFESFIYQCERENTQYILRISHSLHRTPNEIRGEIDWINYLHNSIFDDRLLRSGLLKLEKIYDRQYRLSCFCLSDCFPFFFQYSDPLSMIPPIPPANPLPTTERSVS